MSFHANVWHQLVNFQVTIMPVGWNKSQEKTGSIADKTLAQGREN